MRKGKITASALTAAWLIFLAGLVTACDESDSGTGPEPDFFFSFEAGFEGWRPDSADFCDPNPATGLCDEGSAFAETEVRVVEGPATDGGRAVELAAQNDTDAVKLWIERAFEVSAGTRYEVEVTWDFGTEDLEVGAWTLIATAIPADPSAAFREGVPPNRIGDFLILGDTVSPQGRFAYLRKEFTQIVEAGAAGEVWVGIGVWGTFEVAREYLLDSVTVHLTPLTD
jgi:hypothetical protein